VISPPTLVCTPREATALFFQSNAYMNLLWNKLFRRELLWGMRGKSYASAEDMAVSYQAVHRAHSIAIIPDVLYFYRIHAESAVNGRFRLCHLDAMKSLDDMAADVRVWYPDMEAYLIAHETSFAFTLLKRMIVSRANYPEQEKLLMERIRHNAKPLQQAGLMTRSMRRSYATLRAGKWVFKACVLCKNFWNVMKLKFMPKDAYSFIG